jgi:hypothetical protein
MFNLFFGDLMSSITSVFVICQVIFIISCIVNRGRIDKWGRLILAFIIIGTAISGLSATRDAYMMENAQFSVESIQSIICSIAGAAIFLMGFVSILVKNQKFRKSVFFLVSLLFTIQVLVIEASRIIMK